MSELTVGKIERLTRYTLAELYNLTMLGVEKFVDAESVNQLEQYYAALRADNARLAGDIERLKLAASGRGMVSEMADMPEVAVLVCGLHGKVESLTASLAKMKREREEVEELLVEISDCKAEPDTPFPIGSEGMVKIVLDPEQMQRIEAYRAARSTQKEGKG